MKRYLVLFLLVCLAPLARGQATAVTVIPKPGVPTINVYGDYPLTEGTGQKIANAGSSRVAQGPYFAPTASTNGTELANRPAANATNGVRFELNSGASITYYIGTTGATPTGPPPYAKTVTVAGTTDEPLSGTDTIFVTATTGTIICRWVQR